MCLGNLSENPPKYERSIGQGSQRDWCRENKSEISSVKIFSQILAGHFGKPKKGTKSLTVERYTGAPVTRQASTPESNDDCTTRVACAAHRRLG